MDNLSSKIMLKAMKQSREAVVESYELTFGKKHDAILIAKNTIENYEKLLKAQLKIKEENK